MTVDKEKIISAFTELEFRNMAKRVLGEDISISSVQKASQTKSQLEHISRVMASKGRLKISNPKK